MNRFQCEILKAYTPSLIFPIVKHGCLVSGTVANYLRKINLYLAVNYFEVYSYCFGNNNSSYKNISRRPLAKHFQIIC